MADRTRRHWLKTTLGTVVVTSASPPSLLAAHGVSPEPYGATPSARQYRWQQLERYGFIHFTINTFTDREWGFGDEDPALFNPSGFDADQIVRVAKTAGLKGYILTAKHHDGFCLWPSAYTEHSVRNSPYKDGKGDIVREVSEACARHGLQFGIYLSPWNRHHPDYGRPAYVTYFHNQLRELLTHYGPLFEVWFDGAFGGDGYYGGARERRRVEPMTYYKWDEIRTMVRTLQPKAVIFADEHMDVRWVGNEEGIAGDPCWPTVDATPFTEAKGNSGTRGGAIWNPAEADVSIRPGWFWHPDEDSQVRSPANLLRLYFSSVGRGVNLLLNMAPDRRGRISDIDIKAVTDWNDILVQTFNTNLAKGAKVSASSTFGKGFAAGNVLKDGRFWAAKLTETAGAWLEIALPGPQTFDVIQFSEDIRLGVRVDDYAVDIFTDGAWVEVAKHTSIGHKRLIRLDVPITTDRVRLRILTAAASPVIGNFGLFKLPDIVEEPVIVRNLAGQVSIRTQPDGLEIYYTLDGTAPGSQTLRYSDPIDLPEGGTLKVVARKPGTEALSSVVTRDFDVAKSGWKIVSTNGTHAENLIADRPFWRTLNFMGPENGTPADIIIDLGKPYVLKGFHLRPPGDPQRNYGVVKNIGSPSGYEAYVSDTPADWGNAVAKGEFSNIAHSRAEQKIRFAAAKSGRYLRIILPRPVPYRDIITVGEIGIITRDPL